MNKPFYLVASVLQLIIGIAGALLFVILAADGAVELLSKRTFSFALSVCFIVIGIKGIKAYKAAQ